MFVLLSGYLASDQANVSVSCVILKANMRFLNISPFFSDITLRMSVRLNVGFQEDLRNTSSALYRSYKTDLETAVGFGLTGLWTKQTLGCTKSIILTVVSLLGSFRIYECGC